MQRIDLQRAAQGTDEIEVQSHEMTIDGIDSALQRCAGDRSTHRGPTLSPCRDAGGCETA